MIILGHGTDAESLIIIGLVVNTVPSLVAAFMSERNTNMIRNGVVTAKAKEGATQALKETGVTDAIANAPAQSATYAKALAAHSEALSTNSQALATIIENWKRDNPNG